MLTLIVSTACRCASESAVHGFVSAALLIGGAAILVAAWWWTRRRVGTRSPSAPSGDGTPVSTGPTGPIVVLVGAFVVALGTTIALAQPSSTLSLLALVVGASGASLGLAWSAARRRPVDEPRE